MVRIPPDLIDIGLRQPKTLDLSHQPRVLDGRQVGGQQTGQGVDRPPQPRVQVVEFAHRILHSRVNFEVPEHHERIHSFRLSRLTILPQARQW